MANVEMYFKSTCPYCIRAEALLGVGRAEDSGTIGSGVGREEESGHIGSGVGAQMDTGSGGGTAAADSTGRDGGMIGSGT